MKIAKAKQLELAEEKKVINLWMSLRCPKSAVFRDVKFDGILYPRMIAEAKAVTKQSANGWGFWKYQLLSNFKKTINFSIL